MKQLSVYFGDYNARLKSFIHLSISAIIHNNVHNAFHPNLMFLSCGNDLLIVCDPSGVLVWSICVKNMFMHHDISV